MQKPYRSICRILISFNELSGVAYQGTGFLVGPHTILTNCLMVYDCSNEHNYGWFDSISISFGTYKDSNGNASNVNTYKFDHNCDTTGGASGSPVIKKSNNLICGIHSGYSYYWFFGNHYTNHACKISTYIVAWIEERL